MPKKETKYTEDGLIIAPDTLMLRPGEKVELRFVKLQDKKEKNFSNEVIKELEKMFKDFDTGWFYAD